MGHAISRRVRKFSQAVAGGCRRWAPRACGNTHTLNKIMAYGWALLCDEAWWHRVASNELQPIPKVGFHADICAFASTVRDFQVGREGGTFSGQG